MIEAIIEGLRSLLEAVKSNQEGNKGMVSEIEDVVGIAEEAIGR